MWVSEEVMSEGTTRRSWAFDGWWCAVTSGHPGLASTAQQQAPPEAFQKYRLTEESKEGIG
jgi:hypothetical protein